MGFKSPFQHQTSQSQSSNEHHGDGTHLPKPGIPHGLLGRPHTAGGCKPLQAPSSLLSLQYKMALRRKNKHFRSIRPTLTVRSKGAVRRAHTINSGCRGAAMLGWLSVGGRPELPPRDAGRGGRLEDVSGGLHLGHSRGEVGVAHGRVLRGAGLCWAAGCTPQNLPRVGGLGAAGARQDVGQGVLEKECGLWVALCAGGCGACRRPR